MLTRRNTSDPLVREFLDTYKINLLSIPRGSAGVGDAYVSTKQGVSEPGQLRHLLVPDLIMPETHCNEQMIDIAGKQTRALDLKLGLKLLEGFFSAIGADLGMSKIGAEYEHKGAGKVRFNLKNATRDSVDPFEFGKALIPCRLNERQGWVADGNRYFATVGVLRSPSITITAEDDRSNTVSIDAGVIENAISAKGKLAIEHGSEGELTYKGNVPLAFGVELVEIIYDENEQKFFITGVTTPQKIRAETVIERAFIGDPEEGSVFIL